MWNKAIDEIRQPKVIKIRVSTFETRIPHDHRAARRQPHARELRRVTEQLLQELRNQYGAGVQHEPQKEHRHGRQRKIAILQHAQIDDRLSFVKLPQNPRHQPDDH
jgi:hypothetical protein